MIQQEKLELEVSTPPSTGHCEPGTVLDIHIYDKIYLHILIYQLGKFALVGWESDGGSGWQSGF